MCRQSARKGTGGDWRPQRYHRFKGVFGAVFAGLVTGGRSARVLMQASELQGKNEKLMFFVAANKTNTGQTATIKIKTEFELSDQHSKTNSGTE